MDIPLPIRGKHQGQAYSDQPALTAVTALNAAGVDPVTLRMRLSQRAGQGRYCSVDFTSDKIDRITSVVTDSRSTEYEPLINTQVETVWQTNLEGTRTARTGVVDRQNAVLVLDGSRTLVKLNADGEKVWSMTIATPDPAQVIDAIDVDDFGNIFLGTSAGGTQEDGRIWRYQPKKGSDTPVLVWTYEVDGYVRRVRVRGDTLTIALNQTDTHSARIVRLFGALSAVPSLGWERDAAYPIADMRLKTNGDVIYTSDAFATRGINPKHANFTEKTVDMRVTDLTDYEKRVWCDLDAARISGIANKAPIGAWLDTSGNGRHLSTGFAAGSTSPIYVASAINGKPAVRFRGKPAGLGVADVMNSGQNPSTDSASIDQQFTTVPAARGSSWAMFLVLRPALDSDGAVTKNQCVFSLPIRTDGVGTAPTGTVLELWVNRSNDTAAGSAGTNTAGFRRGAVSVMALTRNNFEGASDGVGSGVNFVAQGYFNVEDSPTDTGALLVTLVWDSGQNEGVDDGTVPHGTFRVNGKPFDRWNCSTNVSEGPFYLGYSAIAPGDAYYFQGDIARLLVFRGDSEFPGGLMTMPLYPRTIGSITGPGSGVAWNAASDTELEKIEGILMHEYGISHQAPDSLDVTTRFGVTASWTGTGANYDPGHYPHPYQRYLGPPRADGSAVSTPYRLNSPTGIVAKLDGSSGELQWVATSSGQNTPPIALGGVGYGLAVFEDRIFTVGPTVVGGTFPGIGLMGQGYGGDVRHMRCIIDKNGKGQDGYSIMVADGAWSQTFGGLADTWPQDRVGIDTDEFGTVHVPARPASTSTLSLFAPTGNAGLGLEMLSVDLGFLPLTALAQRDAPDYRASDFPDSPTVADEFKRGEFAYLLGSGATEVWKLRLVRAAAQEGSARDVRSLAFAAGSMFTFTRTTAAAPAGSGTLANPFYDPMTGYVSVVPAYGKVWIADGTDYYFYDPKTDVVAKWISNDAGKMPPRCRLAELWNGRLVIARAYDDPHGWHMSERANPQGWDFFPVPRTATMAVSSVSARAGACPDVITSLIPYSDDLLIVGCDSSVWMMRGDPAANGVFDRVSDITGVAFGRSWAKDPSGVIYFFGDQGGVYRMVPGGIPQSMTDGVIDAEMRDVNLGDYNVELSWSISESALRVFVFPKKTPFTAPTQTWYWQQRTDGWFNHSTLKVGVTQSAVYALSGDSPEQRRLIFGGADGRIRELDLNAVNDDSTIEGSEEVTSAIQSVVKWGPIVPGSGADRYRFMQPRFVLDSEQHGCYVKIYAGGDPVQGGVPAWEGELFGGRTRALPMRATGEHIWLELHSLQSQRRWSVESAAIRATEVGRSRV